MTGPGEEGDWPGSSEPSAKCIVFRCLNQQHEGGFVGDLCQPCYVMLRSGVVRQGDTFIHQMKRDLEDMSSRYELAAQRTD